METSFTNPLSVKRKRYIWFPLAYIIPKWHGQSWNKQTCGISIVHRITLLISSHDKSQHILDHFWPPLILKLLLHSDDDLGTIVKLWQKSYDLSTLSSNMIKHRFLTSETLPTSWSDWLNHTNCKWVIFYSMSQKVREKNHLYELFSRSPNFAKRIFSEYWEIVYWNFRVNS